MTKVRKYQACVSYFYHRKNEDSRCWHTVQNIRGLFIAVHRDLQHWRFDIFALDGSNIAEVLEKPTNTKIGDIEVKDGKFQGREIVPDVL